MRSLPACLSSDAPNACSGCFQSLQSNSAKFIRRLLISFFPRSRSFLKLPFRKRDKNLWEINSAGLPEIEPHNLSRARSATAPASAAAADSRWHRHPPLAATFRNSVPSLSESHFRRFGPEVTSCDQLRSPDALLDTPRNDSTFVDGFRC